MNKLQNLKSREQFYVTLNPAGMLDESHLIARMNYEHPVFTHSGVSAAERLKKAGGPRLAFAGAHFGWGFHEDGARSGLEAAQKLGRDYSRLVVFSSLSKRSNVPGMRSGFVAGDAKILEQFLLYRTYHGCAMSPAVQAASIAAWNDEAHVIENRRLYAEKFKRVTPMLEGVLGVEMPDAAFYLWARSKESDTETCK